jgi:hypothetical protein
MGQNVDITMLGLSTQDDGTTRLHVAAEAATASLMFHFEEPLVCHVANEITGKYLADSYVRFVEDDHGDPHRIGALHTGRISTSGLDTTANDNEKVVWKFGVQGGSWTDTTAGTFYSDVLEIALGSGVGVSAKGSLHELTFTRRAGDATKRAAISEFQVDYSKKTLNLKGYVVTLNLVESVRLQDDVEDAEEAIDNLETIETEELLVPFSIGGRSAIQVEMVDNEWTLDSYTPGDGEGDQLGRLRGTAVVTVEERV